MAAAIITVARFTAFAIIAASAIVTLYAAVDAMAVYTDLSVFTAGLLILVCAVVAGPFFCFIAGYGLVYYLDFAVRDAILITAPVLIAWSVAVLRLARRKLGEPRRD